MKRSAFFASQYNMQTNNWFYSNGNRIVDLNGWPVSITGINWFGFETEREALFGLDKANLKEIVETTAEIGFNLYRIPLCIELVTKWRSGTYPPAKDICVVQNPELNGIDSLSLFERLLDCCKASGIKILLDMHRVVNTRKYNTWCHGNFTMSEFIESWRWLAERYKDNDTIIGFDIFNEPHGKPFQEPVSTCTKWDGSSDVNNWKFAVEAAATAIHKAHPNVLIMVEGIECYPKWEKTWQSNQEVDYHLNWWGGNLRGVKDFPIDLGAFNNKLVYEPHDYGPTVAMQPWLNKTFDEQSLLNDCWYDNWFFIHEQKIAPLLIGEWGCQFGNPQNEHWFRLFATFIQKHRLSHTFWCLNPESVDTDGMLLSDWTTIDYKKLEVVKKTLWTDFQNRPIGLDPIVPLGKKGVTYTQFYESQLEMEYSAGDR